MQTGKMAGPGTVRRVRMQVTAQSRDPCIGKRAFASLAEEKGQESKKVTDGGVHNSMEQARCRQWNRASREYARSTKHRRTLKGGVSSGPLVPSPSLTGPNSRQTISGLAVSGSNQTFGESHKTACRYFRDISGPLLSRIHGWLHAAVHLARVPR